VYPNAPIVVLVAFEEPFTNRVCAELSPLYRAPAMYATLLVVEVSVLVTKLFVPPAGGAVFRAVPIAVVPEGCCSAKASVNELESTFVGVAKLTTRLFTVEFPDIIYTANTVRLLVVFTFGPVKYDTPPKFMVGRPFRPVLLMVGGVTVAVALHPNPDLSLHVEIAAPSVAGTPVAFGSLASNHRVHPATVADGENHVVSMSPYTHPFEGPV
jgi:hypothetical protein